MEKLLSSLGQVTAVIGAQWGDEGKGKVVDILTEKYDVIARASGGANAGHTIVIDEHKHVCHLLPSGCFHPNKEVVLGAGMVLHLPTLLEEIDLLKDHDIDIVPHLHISPSAHILFNYHKDIDALQEAKRAESKGQGLGTTKRGIGPAYEEKIARTGIRMEQLDQDLEAELREHKRAVKERYGIDVDLQKELENVSKAKDVLGHVVKDTIALLNTYHDEGKTILLEGAQATMLDIDHGTYPFVTSSSTTASGALQALGLRPSILNSCIGVAKAYCTRVGGGPFLSEAGEERANVLRERGGEYGATTGRPRRCGWLHIPDLKLALQINGYTHWNITKLDVLDEEESIPVGVGRDDHGSIVYEELPGWKHSTVGLTDYEKLPVNAKKYVEFIEKHTDIPVSLIGTGQGRGQMIVRD